LNFAISASLGGLAGVLWAADRAFVAEQGFGFLLAVELLVGLVIGGVATIPGAVVGAFVVVFVREFTKGLQIPLGFTTIDGEGPLSQAIYGGILVIVTFFAPGGLVWMFRLFRAKLYRVIPQPPELSEPVVPLGEGTATLTDA
jgi:branched-chain amino acid transport system permease protein